MASVVLPTGTCDLPALIQAMQDASVFQEPWDTLAVTAPTGCFVRCSAMAFLCAWGRSQTRAGRRIRILGDSDLCRYLSRMNLHRHLGVEEIEMTRHSEEGRFLPLETNESDEDTARPVRAIRGLIEHQFDDSETFLTSAVWAMSEIVENILLHAEADDAGAVCAQYFPKKHQLDIGICDVGCGIRASLGRSRPLWSHGQAVTEALQRGVTRGVGLGNGLAGTKTLAEENRGRFRLWTGNVIYSVGKGREKGFAEIPKIPGTGVLLSLDTRRPVDLRNTWMAAYAGVGYFAEQVPLTEDADAEPAVEQSLRIVDECASSTRNAAGLLREKVLGLLESGTNVALDFEGFDLHSSSFQDELFGRLVEAIGGDAFRRRVKARNLSDTDRRIANTVISQRLAGGRS